MDIKKIIFFLSFLLIGSAWAEQIANKNYDTKLFGKNQNLPTVAIITTGGTIAQKVDDKGKVVPSLSGDELIAAVPSILKIANIKLVPFSNIDSSQMSPARWLELSKVVNEILNDKKNKIDGVVVTHGTDTMSEGVYFLDLVLGSNKPVVFTGSGRDASDISADGPSNLYNAVLTASSRSMQDCGAVVAFNQYINFAFDIRKIHTTHTQTFGSGENGPLGSIEKDKITKNRTCDRRDRPQFIPSNTLPEVALIKIVAGDDGHFIR
ncbi:MAG: asparaginase [bacterium]